ncbi:MAG: hypothetical protein AAGB22_15370, partial [Bacteroidota bacterium]
MKWLVSLFVLLVAGIGYGQANLVPNASFEDWDSCGTGVSNPSIARPWFNPAGSTSDVFHPCSDDAFTVLPNAIFGYQQARTGQAMGGVMGHMPGNANIPGYTEVLSCPLVDTLWRGVHYELSMWINLHNESLGPMNQFGMYVSQDVAFVPDTTVG